MHLLLLILGQRNLLVRESVDAPWSNYWDLRNLSRKAGSPGEGSPFPEFREWSRIWLERWEQQPEETKPLLRLALLPPLLEEWSAEQQAHTRLIMFQTDQRGLMEERKAEATAKGERPGRDFSTGDTCYTGPLIAALLQAAYPALTIEPPRSIPCDVGDINALAQYFRQELSQLKRTFPTAGVTVAEAGGPGQIKTSLFLVSEFFFDQQSLQRYVVKEGNSHTESKVERQDAFEFRRIILGEQILGLLRPLAYEGATALIPQVDHPDWQELTESLRFAQDRKNLLYDAAQEHTQHLLQRTHQAEITQFLTAYAADKTPWPVPDWLSELFSPKSYFQLCEQIALTEYYLRISERDYTQVVLTANQFIEGYLNAFGEEAYPEKERTKKYNQAIQTLVKDHNWKRPNSHSLPFKIVYAEAHAAIEHQALLDDMKGLNSRFTQELSKKRKEKYALDKVRNLIAHEGKGVSRETFEQIPHLRQRIARWYRAFGLPEENPYQLLNHWIEEQLKDLAKPSVSADS